MERIRIEHKQGQYNSGVILKEWQHKISKEMDSSDFGDLMEAIDVRLYHQWADGNNIFYLTERQYLKLVRLISQSEYKL